MDDLRFVVVGAGYWARFQLAAWRELSGAQCLAVANRTRSKAEALAAEFGIPKVYTDLTEMLAREKPDVLNILTPPETRRKFIETAAAHKVAVICQSPLGSTLAEARALSALCDQARVPLLVHETWRWQAPLRELKQALDSGVVGQVFRARLRCPHGLPHCDRDPAAPDPGRFLLNCLGAHLLDTARMLFGEANSIYCRTARLWPGLLGDEAATTMLGMETGATVTCELICTSRVENQHCPETLVVVEGSEGMVELAPDFWLRSTTSRGSQERRCPPPSVAGQDPRDVVMHAAAVECLRNLMGALRDQSMAETRAHDHLKTLELVAGAFDSARTGRAVRLGPVLA